MSKVSVIVPAFNSERTIERAIRSIYLDNLIETETIVVDDGSTDRTTEVVRNLSTEFEGVKLITTKNSGPAAARNAGIKTVRGELVAFLDADDEWLPGKMEKQIPEFDDPQVGLVYSDCHVVREGKSSLWSKNNRLISGRPLRELAEENFIPTVTVVLRAETFKKTIGFDPAIKYGEDYDLWFRTIASGWKMKAILEPLASYYFALGFSENYPRKFEDYQKIYEKWQQIVGLDGRVKEVITRKIHYYQGLDYRAKFVTAVKENKFSQASQFAWKRFRNSPFKVKYLLAAVLFKAVGIFR